jgi:lipopolysaccharide export system protein LptA
MTRPLAPGRLLVAALFAAVFTDTASLQAQQPNGPPNALQGFSQNQGKPINIHSASLEVRDKDKMATFAGDVHMVQGDTTLRSKTLVVFYEDEPGAKPAKGPVGPAGQKSGQQIRRVEAKGGVIVVQKDQTATGDNGVFDMHANTVTLLGNVVISQGQNVVKGERLTVDMTTGVSRVECDRASGQCRVQALFQPGAMKQPEGRAPEGRTPEGRTPESRTPEGPAGHETPRQRGPQPSGLY